MQKLGGRGWGILAGAIGGANKAYDEYAEKEVKKQLSQHVELKAWERLNVELQQVPMLNSYQRTNLYTIHFEIHAIKDDLGFGPFNNLLRMSFELFLFSSHLTILYFEFFHLSFQKKCLDNF